MLNKSTQTTDSDVKRVNPFLVIVIVFRPGCDPVLAEKVQCIINGVLATECYTTVVSTLSYYALFYNSVYITLLCSVLQ